MALHRCLPSAPAGPRGDRGFTLVEVIIAGAVLAVGACALVAALVNGMTLAKVNRETSLATQAAREVVERLHGVALKDVFRSFNVNPLDDPLGYRTAPGSTFAIGPSASLGPRKNLTGEVIMPVDDAGRLREYITDPGLGMPRDLNGDGAIDTADHSSDYVILPVRVRVTWQGVAGARVVEASTVLGGG